jgi:hypothetical protein
MSRTVIVISIYYRHKRTDLTNTFCTMSGGTPLFGCETLNTALQDQEWKSQHQLRNNQLLMRVSAVCRVAKREQLGI